MKRRIISTLMAVALTLSLVFTLASCDPWGKFENALKNTFTGEHGYDVVAVVTGTVEENGVLDEVNIKYEIKIDKTNSAKTCVKITVDGNPASATTYYTDGEYVYLNFGNNGVKMTETDFKKSSGWMQEDIRSNLLKPVWGERDGQINDADCTEADGVTVWSRGWAEPTPIAERHWLMYAPSNVLSNALFAYVADYDSTAMYATEFDNANLTATAKDGFVTAITTTATLTYEDISATLKADITVNNPETDVSVTLPAGCASWDEMTFN